MTAVLHARWRAGDIRATDVPSAGRRCWTGGTPGALHHRVAIAHFRAVRLEMPEDRTVVEPYEHPADVEHDIADQALHGVTLPPSPGRALTATTVALGKKLNSEALAQVYA